MARNSETELWLIIVEALFCFVVYLYTKSMLITNITMLHSLITSMCHSYFSRRLNAQSLALYISSVVMVLLSITYDNMYFLKLRASLLIFGTAICFLFSPYLFDKPAIYYVMGGKSIPAIKKFFDHLDHTALEDLNFSTATLFLVLSCLNVIIMLFFSNEIWMFFKYVIIPAMIGIFAILQFILYRKQDL